MKIKDIGTVVTGKTPATSHAEFYDGDYMFVTPTELHGGYKVSSSEKTITDEGIKSIKSNTIDGISVFVFVKRKCEQKGPKKVSTFSTRFHVVSNVFPKYQMLTF